MEKVIPLPIDRQDKKNPLRRINHDKNIAVDRGTWNQDKNVIKFKFKYLDGNHNRNKNLIILKKLWQKLYLWKIRHLLKIFIKTCIQICPFLLIIVDNFDAFDY